MKKVEIILSVLIASFFIASILIGDVLILSSANCKFVEALPDIFEKLSDFYSVMLGIYIAILVLLSTSHTPVSTLLHQKGLVRDFQRKITASISCGIIFIILNIIFCFLTCRLMSALLLSVGLLGLFFMVQFVTIVIKVFEYNMQKLEEESRIKNGKIENLITLIEDVEKNTRK